MRYLLDTSIISNVIKPAPSPSLLTWMAEQNDEDLFIASLAVAEMRRSTRRDDETDDRAGRDRDENDGADDDEPAHRRGITPASMPSLSNW
jgi:predicted nucleic acid-binding protein